MSSSIVTTSSFAMPRSSISAELLAAFDSAKPVVSVFLQLSSTTVAASWLTATRPALSRQLKKTGSRQFDGIKLTLKHKNQYNRHRSLKCLCKCSSHYSKLCWKAFWSTQKNKGRSYWGEELSGDKEAGWKDKNYLQIRLARVLEITRKIKEKGSLCLLSNLPASKWWSLA